MNEKTVGYALLSVGLIIMFYAMLQIYLVFTNQIKPIPIFSAQSASFDLSSLMQSLPTYNLPGNAPANLKLPSKAGKVDLLSADTLNQTLNMTSEFFLMSFLVGFGGKIASLGITLVRPIVVKLKAKEVAIDNGQAEKVSLSVPQPQLK